MELVLLCSGQPGDEPFKCVNVAQVRLVRLYRWQRPMCVACADAFDARMAAEELPLGEYVEIDPPAFEPPIVTPIGNMHELLAHVCLTKD
jgi:hypothetical protein